MLGDPSPASIRTVRVLEPDLVPGRPSPWRGDLLEASVATVVGALLRTVRDQLGLDAAFLSELRGHAQVMLHVETTAPLALTAGDVLRRDSAIGQLVLDARLPAVLGDVARHPEAGSLPAALLLPIGSYVCVPLTLSDGTDISVCATAVDARPNLGVHELRMLEVAAHEVARAIGDTRGAQVEGAAVRRRIEALLDEGGPRVVCQPIVDLRSAERTGVEVLARFDDGRCPDVWFEEAADAGLGVELELAVARRAAALFDRLPGAIGINLSARALVDPRVVRLLSALPAGRLVVELTEHERVEDYDALATVLTPLRRRGMSLAVDDAGAGFASLRHVLRLGPDWIKLDHGIVHEVDVDPSRAALLAAMVVFADKAGMHVCAEGVETDGEAQAVLRLGAQSAQGWHFGRPVAAHEISGWIPPSVPAPRSPHGEAVLDRSA